MKFPLDNLWNQLLMGHDWLRVSEMILTCCHDHETSLLQSSIRGRVALGGAIYSDGWPGTATAAHSDIAARKLR
ncbi:MAG: hypothetical protein WC997_15675 [Porticoccaceae bacterium]|jgi:hypothetical protein